MNYKNWVQMGYIFGKNVINLLKDISVFNRQQIEILGQTQ